MYMLPFSVFAGGSAGWRRNGATFLSICTVTSLKLQVELWDCWFCCFANSDLRFFD
jgi:hypothetical protein